MRGRVLENTGSGPTGGATLAVATPGATRAVAAAWRATLAVAVRGTALAVAALDVAKAAGGFVSYNKLLKLKIFFRPNLKIHKENAQFKLMLCLHT